MARVKYLIPEKGTAQPLTTTEAFVFIFWIIKHKPTKPLVISIMQCTYKHLLLCFWLPCVQMFHRKHVLLTPFPGDFEPHKIIMIGLQKYKLEKQKCFSWNAKEYSFDAAVAWLCTNICDKKMLEFTKPNWMHGVGGVLIQNAWKNTFLKWIYEFV